MKKLIFTLTTALILTGAIALFCNTSDAVSEPVAQEIVKEIKPELTDQQIETLKESCIMIYADNGETQVQGSAVAIGENRYLTAYHMIAYDRTNLKTSDGEKLTIESYDSYFDIMSLTSESEGVPVKLGNSDSVRLGDEVTIIGSPMGEKNTVIHTTIKMIGREMEAYNIVKGGTSGGGVFNERGELIGIITGGNPEEYETCFTPINVILEKL